MVVPNCGKSILNFKLIFNDKIDSKFNIASHLTFFLKKTTKPFTRNLTHQGISNRNKLAQISLKVLVLILLSFL
jgi:hypothetical protein